MFEFQSLEMLLRLLVAVVLGGIIGLERGGAKHAAGLRTHIILCLGAAGVMVVSESLVLRFDIPSELMRMGAQIISGVGFLGAGNILVNRGQVHGITTATGLWTTACVGIATGSGCYLIAITMVILMMSVMLGLRSMSQKIRAERIIYILKMKLEDARNTEVILNRILSSENEFTNINIVPTENSGVMMTMNISAAHNVGPEMFMDIVSGIGTVYEFSEV